ncbi:MAG: hypothetical protein EOM19_02590 [Candidatus Moranbacteria bacterium]|nr:hypothetical protein [Candidatus Moranbacteria bacterium]
MFIFQNKKKKNFCKAFTLIEVLLVIFIASTVVATFLNVFSQGSRLLLESKKSLVATSLANEYMEMIRNLSYDAVGISGGIPSGPLQAIETKEKNGTQYTIYTDVRYKDDPYDGILGGSPNDFVNTDYKLVTIRISWGSEGSQQDVRLSSIFVPPGMETSLGAGTLAINIIDAFGMGVPFVSITIKNDSEGILFSTVTDELGNIFLPGAPEAQQSYEIVASKLSYETVSTYPPYPLSAFTPIDEHSSVLEGELTNKVIVMNPLAHLDIFFKDFVGNPLSNMQIQLIGGRLLGTLPTLDDLYAYDNSFVTDTEGRISLDGMSPGTYSLFFSEEVENEFEFISMKPTLDQEERKFFLEPGTSSEVNVIFSPRNKTMLSVLVKESVGEEPLSGTRVRLQNLSGYDKEILTNEQGIALFYEETVPLEIGLYDMSIALDGYGTQTQQVQIDEGFQQEEISLISQ